MAISTANDVANFFLWYANEHGDGEPPSNKKIQKLVYYAHAWYLSLYDKRLFDEPIEAWVNGPVIPVLYHRFKEYGWSPIPEKVDKPDLLPQVLNHLDETADVFMPLDAWELEQMTHAELPWQNARKGYESTERCNVIIADEDMKEFFRKVMSEPDIEEN